jgi:O-antigen/teichoic acid export membrane protein
MSMSMSQRVEVFFEDHKESGDLGRRALRGGIVSIARQYGIGALQIVAAVVLARLLAPEDFGLVTIVTVLTSFAPLLIDFGLGDATTQRSKITPDQVSSLFWLSTGIGLAITVVVAACSPLIAAVYHEPKLEPIALCSSVIFVLWGLSGQHLALLRRTMQFAAIAKLQLLGTLAGIVIAIAAAMCGYGYWALVLRPIANALFVVCGAWMVCKWRPGFPVFDSNVKSMIRFGLNVVGFSVTYTVARSVDRIALGLYYLPAQVGYYQNAMTLFEYSISMTLGQVHTVGSAALSKLQSNPVALRQKFQVALSTLAFYIMPMAAILSVTARDVTVILLGEKWHAAGVLLGILALRGIFSVIESAQGWLHLSIGRADRWKNWGFVSLGVMIVATAAGLPFGPIGVAAGGVIASVVIALPSVVYAGSPIGIGATLVIRAVGPQLIGAIATAAGGWWLQSTALADATAPVRILLSVSFCACIYLFIVVGLFRLTAPVRIAMQHAGDLLRKR